MSTQQELNKAIEGLKEFNKNYSEFIKRSGVDISFLENRNMDIEQKMIAIKGCVLSIRKNLPQDEDGPKASARAGGIINYVNRFSEKAQSLNDLKCIQGYKDAKSVWEAKQNPVITPQATLAAKTTTDSWKSSKGSESPEWKIAISQHKLDKPKSH